ncbi:hypothetical protein NDU88_009071 [Pleurodeles waltl]|uniref:Uncharacterized protein n=1 Tax=Pleurodeles waltl TaxID=8319 RepID=A0AAV7PTK4_PLEWA|nr:hypothetical protein NDU88_009071 [Pleurodeles waltl]
MYCWRLAQSCCERGGLLGHERSTGGLPVRAEADLVTLGPTGEPLEEQRLEHLGLTGSRGERREACPVRCRGTRG